MEPREVTAEDVAWSLNRAIDGATWGSGSLRTEKGGWIDSIYAFDDTVIFETSTFVPLSISWRDVANGSGTGIYCPETVEAGADDYYNLVGTGPFMFKEHVIGSHVSYIRNPHYWDMTTINGVEYEIPFVDEFVYVGVGDAATRVAALRTGKLDVYYTVPMEYVHTISEKNPEIIQEKWSMSSQDYISLRCDRPPFNNKEVRRAMMIGMDLEAIAKSWLGIWDEWGWPLQTSSPAYTPRDELPASSRELYEYDPAKARQILTDQGYPEGLTGVEIGLLSDPHAIDAAEMTLAYWKDIDVQATMKVMEAAAYYAAGDAGELDCMTEGMKTMDLLQAIKQMYILPNRAFYENPALTALYEEAKLIRDEDEQVPLLREIALMALDEVAYIPLFPADTRVCMWWPWLRNFYGEFAIGSWNPGYAISTAWIDQDLKEEMGY